MHKIEGEGILSSLRHIRHKIVKGTNNLVHKVEDVTNDIVNNAGDITKDVINDVGNTATNTVNSMGNTTNNIISDVEKTTNDTVNKVEKYGDAVINGRNDYPPKVRNIINKYGGKVIRNITICRSPVPKVLTSALSFASLGKFGKNLSKSPYDQLFHLFIRIQLDDNTIVTLEKNEVINMDVNPSIPKDTETKIVNNVPQITLQELLDNAKNKMGINYFTYSAKSNNCQDFILAVFNGNNIGDQSDREFIKQDTQKLFKNLTGLRKFSNTITDIGAKANVITQGAGIEKKSRRRRRYIG
jgi:hypothetical protein